MKLSIVALASCLIMGSTIQLQLATAQQEDLTEATAETTTETMPEELPEATTEATPEAITETKSEAITTDTTPEAAAEATTETTSSEATLEPTTEINPVLDEPQINDDRQSVTKIDPQKPIQITVKNQSGVAIIVLLTEPASSERKVLPDQSTAFGRLHTSYLPLPIDLMTYTDVPGKQLRGNLEVKENEILVTIKTAKTNNGQTKSVRVDEAGNIYLY